MAGTPDLSVYTLCRLAGLLLALLSPAARAGAAEYYGYDQGGSRFAPLDQITPGMSTNWSRPGPITPAISRAAPRMC